MTPKTLMATLDLSDVDLSRLEETLMDEADQAQRRIEQEEEIWQRQRAARQAAEARDDCRDCEEPLEAHRRAFGICIPCQRRRERDSELRGRRFL